MDKLTAWIIAGCVIFVYMMIGGAIADHCALKGYHYEDDDE